MGNPVVLAPEARKVCNLSGLEQKRLEGKLLKLQDLEATLDIALKDVAQAADDEQFWRKMELCAKLVQVICDLTIAGLEEAAEKTGAGPAAKTVSILYDVSKILVDALNGGFTVKKGVVFSTNAKVDGIAAALEDGGGNSGKVLSRMKVLANLVDDLHEYWSERGTELRSPSGLVGARNTVHHQLLRIRQEIREIRELLSCSPALQQMLH